MGRWRYHPVLLVSDQLLARLWPQLTKSARQLLLKEMEMLVEGYSGLMELHCWKGGVRLLRLGSGTQDYKPADTEYMDDPVRSTANPPA